MAHRPTTNEKPVHWIGSSKSDLLALPPEVVSAMGYALGLAQLGGKHPQAKPWKGEGAGVFEMVESFESNAYRGIYTVRFEGVVYVLHVFQKKSPSGIRTRSRPSVIRASPARAIPRAIPFSIVPPAFSPDPAVRLRSCGPCHALAFPVPRQPRHHARALPPEPQGLPVDSGRHGHGDRGHAEQVPDEIRGGPRLALERERGVEHRLPGS